MLALGAEGRPHRRIARMPDRGNMVAIVGCPNCSAAVRVLQRGATPSQLAGWSIGDAQLCKAPPISECPNRAPPRWTGFRARTR